MEKFLEFYLDLDYADDKSNMNRKICLLFLALLIIIVVMQFFSVDQDVAAYMYISLFSLTPLFLALKSKKNIDVFEPPFVILFICLIGIFLRSIVLSINLAERQDLLDLVGTSDFTIGCFLCFLFNLSFSATYSISPALPQFSFPTVKLPKSVSNFVLVIVILIGLYLIHSLFVSFNTYSQILSGNISSKKLFDSEGARIVNGYFRFGEVIFTSLFIVSYYKFLAGLEKFKKVWIASALIAVIFNFITSSRISIFLILSYGLLIRSFFKPKVLSLKILGLAFSVFLLVTYMTGFRQNSSDISFDIYDDLSSISEQISRETYSFTLDKAVAVTSRVPEHSHYLMGQTFVAPLFAPVPRSMWQEKPLVRPGPQFAVDIFQSRNDTSGIPPSFPIELYWNFGWLGVISGASVLGAFSSSAYQRACQFRKQIAYKSKLQSLYKDGAMRTKVSENEEKYLFKLKNNFEVLNYCMFLFMFLFPLMISDFSGGIITYIETMIAVRVVFSLVKDRRINKDA